MKFRKVAVAAVLFGLLTACGGRGDAESVAIEPTDISATDSTVDVAGDAAAIDKCAAEPGMTSPGEGEQNFQLEGAFQSTVARLSAWYLERVGTDTTDDPQPPDYLKARPGDEVLYVCHWSGNFGYHGPPRLDGGAPPPDFTRAVHLLLADGEYRGLLYSSAEIPVEQP